MGGSGISYAVKTGDFQLMRKAGGHEHPCGKCLGIRRDGDGLDGEPSAMAQGEPRHLGHCSGADTDESGR
jgi:hypothetical protein